MSGPKDKGPFGESEEHQSWGMLQFSRVTHGGPTRLFGSSLDNHATTVVLSLWQGRRSHHLSEDWFSGGDELAKVELSAAQFAGLLTTMNIGHGVPCTIRRLDGKEMPEPPEDLRESERARESFGADVEALMGKLTGLLEQSAKALEQGVPTAAARKDIRARIASVVQDIRLNLPFVLRQFDRATERITTAAKAEVDAFVTQAATALGIERLRELTLGGKDGAEPARLPGRPKGGKEEPG